MMRKKILMILGAVALMAAILSVSVFAADAGTAQMTDYGVITVMLEKLTLNVKAFFNILDAVYTFFAGLFG